jgi:hypothetical protein
MASVKLPLEVEHLDVFRCPVCKAGYPTRQEAEACVARGLDSPIVKVGDIVTLSYGYGWFDGDIRWVVNPEVRVSPGPEPSRPVRSCPRKKGNCFEPCCTMGFYYVITVIDHSGHRTRYHALTKALTGKGRPAGGWTFNTGHVRPVLVKKPKRFLVKDSADLIGQKAGHLL